MAVTILSIGLLVLLGGFADGGRADRSATLMARGVFLAEGLLDRRLAAGDLAAGEEQGEFEAAEGYRWSLRAQVREEPPAASSAPATTAAASAMGKEPVFLDVALEVTWPDAGRQGSVILETIAPQPEESTP